MNSKRRHQGKLGRTGEELRDGSAVSAGAEKLRKLKAEARCPVNRGLSLRSNSHKYVLSTSCVSGLVLGTGFPQ